MSYFSSLSVATMAVAAAAAIAVAANKFYSQYTGNERRSLAFPRDYSVMGKATRKHVGTVFLLLHFSYKMNYKTRYIHHFKDATY